MNSDDESAVDKAAAVSSALVLGVDLDGVCGDYIAAFRQVVAQERGVDPATMGDPHAWDFRECPDWPINSNEEFSELHRIAVEEHNMFATMDEIDGASDALWHLSDQGVYIRIVTHRLIANFGHAKAVLDTTEWLQHPRDDGRPRIPYRDLCFAAAKADVGADLYIDDGPHNVESLRRARRDVICFDASYNRHVLGKRAANWDEVVFLVERKLRDLGLQ